MVPFMSMITDPVPDLCKLIPVVVYFLLLKSCFTSIGQSSGTDHLFKAALLDTMVQLVNVGTVAPLLNPFKN